MNNHETYLEVNDYLDLYNFAKANDDESWKHEIIEKLKNFDHSGNRKKESIVFHKLLSKYRNVNEEILELYQQLRIEPENRSLEEKIWKLKHLRLLLGRRIHSGKN
ncbi:hypothetical protein KP78_32500 [Jeotgalibacillus soli]|uniref:Uncharacterized protein n=2 Tax=Jeotgalibacillus soli TaxID=889306 RepID=A0A0C2VIF7_9BACL|nr:hypothetical protein KP78_32500 [Jeotgalibacillus soli]